MGFIISMVSITTLHPFNLRSRPSKAAVSAVDTPEDACVVMSINREYQHFSFNSAKLKHQDLYEAREVGAQG